MGPTIKIVCQNLNGPCSFIALCNVLILRGDIHITPPSRQSVTYSFLSALVGDHLLRSSSPKSPLSLEAALEILPSTRYGLDLNPRFGHIDGFRQSGEAKEEGKQGSGELALFAMSKVPLLHGWVVDPQDEQTWDAVVEKTGDYDAALEKIVEGEVIAGEQVEDGEEDEEKVMKAVEARSLWTAEQEEKVQQAHLIRKFLSASRTQLTYHGLFLLSSHLAPSSLSALFRNSHLSVLFRRPSTPTPSSTPQLGNEGPALFTLVTDESFANEPDVVWESLEDVEGGASEFYDGALSRSSPRGGDWVRRRGEEGLISRERREQERTDAAAPLEGRRPPSLSAVDEVARYEQGEGRSDNE
ncbi:hypothetical protein BCR35DRAFT_273434 [Leucosporidium creatinivorum]|uniref:MINDY deubiquitinase domain-containing protein n=1 Tax=Leucosporidium creatinivorum TaxID=106004 RepID=A0A1Y2BR15_9BASI|nr:hypothetical protein BCR35DRAFT_273434 [Leucosporidium creatinivorum]